MHVVEPVRQRADLPNFVGDRDGVMLDEAVVSDVVGISEGAKRSREAELEYTPPGPPTQAELEHPPRRICAVSQREDAG